MPSLCTKQAENGGPATAPSPPPETSVNQALALVEKKVRNLEKRKGKLDGYRAEVNRGKKLNEDQQLAVSKYDEVLGNLELVRDISTQVSKLVQDEARDKKKMLKREFQDKARAELAKVSYFLKVQQLLVLLPEEGSTEMLAELAPKITSKELGALTRFSALLKVERGEQLDKFESTIASAAEHFINLAEKKPKSVAGSTYKELGETVDCILDSGFLTTPRPINNGQVDEAETPEDEDTEPGEEEEEEEVQVEQPQHQKPVNGHFKDETAASQMLGQHTLPPQAPEPSAPLPPAPAHQEPAPSPPKQLTPEPSFNFLQESQIDIESPIMDPAVVMVQGGKRPDQTFPPAPIFGQVNPSLNNMDSLSQQLLQQHAVAMAHHQQQLQQQQQQPQQLQHQQQQPQQLQQQQQHLQQPHQEVNRAPNGFPDQQQPSSKEQQQWLTEQQRHHLEQQQRFQEQQQRARQQPFPPQQQQRPTVDQQQQQSQRPDQQRPPQEQRQDQARGGPKNPRAEQAPAVDPKMERKPAANVAKPAGYAAAAGSSYQQPDTEIGTWRPENGGANDSGDEGQQRPNNRGRGGGGGGRGFGGRGRGYSRGGRGGGERGGYRGRGGERGGDRGGDREYRGERNDRGGDRGDRGDRGDNRPRGGDRNDRPRGSGPRGGRGGGGGGGGRGGRGGAPHRD